MAKPVIYEIYPRSFRDTTGSGEGDLNGVTRGLDHVAELGVDAVWIAPFYPSPMVDGGYDVADHRDVDPRFGTLDDFDALVRRAHGLGLKVLIDMVFNHTSDRHPWFQEALAGDAAMAERYVFADPAPDGFLPNRWLSFFGPPAWTWAHQRRQYYLHQFLSCQPNLNLRNPEVQAEHRATMRFWRDRGVDGFRLDAVSSYLPNTDLVDNDAADPHANPFAEAQRWNPFAWQTHDRTMMTEDCASYMETIRDWAGDAYLLGENGRDTRSVELARTFAEPGRLDASYTTDLRTRVGDAGAIADYLGRAGIDGRLPAWLNAHDQPRIASTWPSREAAAKVHLLLLAVLPGPVILYQGEELGLPQPDLGRGELRDPFDLMYWPDGPGRDGSRVPIPWDRSHAYGFTDGDPWLPMRWSPGLSIAEQNVLPDSVLSFARRVLSFRAREGLSEPSDFEATADGDVLTLRFAGAGGMWTALVNLGAARAPVPDPLSGADALIATTEIPDGFLPGRAAAIWQDGTKGFAAP